MLYVEEDTCMSYEEEDTCMSCGGYMHVMRRRIHASVQCCCWVRPAVRGSMQVKCMTLFDEKECKLVDSNGSRDQSECGCLSGFICNIQCRLGAGELCFTRQAIKRGLLCFTRHQLEEGTGRL